MKNRNKHLSRLVLSLVVLASFPLPVSAYIGPGAGLSSIGTAIAFLGLVLLLVVGFCWYPIKILFFNKKTEKKIGDQNASADSDKAQGL